MATNAHSAVPTTIARRSRGRWFGLLVAVAALQLALPGPYAQAQAIQDGVNYLESVQNGDGTWGNSIETRNHDTAVVVDTLGLLGIGSQAFDDGLNAVASQVPRNFDELARQIALVAPTGDVTDQANELFSGQTSDVFDPLSPDYPGRGWGVAAGFGISVIDTALARAALDRAGLGAGLAVIGDTIPAAGLSSDFPVEIPLGASNIFLQAIAVTGNTRFAMAQPGGATFTVDITPGVTPINIGPFAFAAGTWTLTAENLTGAPVTYTVEVSYMAGDGSSSTRMTRPMLYLGRTQNPDGGWGINDEGDSQIMVTSEVARNLEGQINAVVPGLPAAATWLASKQNGDGGYSSEPASSNVTETALALRGIGLSDPAAPLAAGVAFLESQQLGNGSWGNDANMTALALQALLLNEPRAAPVITSDGGGGIGADYSTNASIAVITGDLPFGAVGIIVSDPSAIVEIDLVAGTFTITVNLAAGANLITITGVDGFGRQGASEAITITRDQTLATQTIKVGPGINFRGLGVEPSNPLTAIGLINLLGNDAQSVSRLNASTVTYETVERDNGGFLGSDFDLHALDCFIVKSDALASADIIGSIAIPETVDLVAGIDSLTLPNPPVDLTAFILLALIGDDSVISAIQRFNTSVGAFETAGFDNGEPSGTDFEIEPSVCYLVYMRAPLAGFTLPVDTSATIQINSPTDGATVTTSPLTVSGDVTGTEPLTVTVNGVPAVVVGTTFTADVPLVEGANVLAASLTDAAMRNANDTINVTFELVDYSLPPSGSVSDTRIFTGPQAVLDQIAFFSETQIGVPAEVTYATLGVSRISATEIEVSFQIDIAPGATPGFVQFQIEYGLFDAGSNPLGPLAGNLFDFRIEITP